MKTIICYTNPFLISEELKETILSFSFNRENLEEIKEMLEVSNADCDGENSSLISEIAKIFKYEDEVESHLDVG